MRGLALLLLLACCPGQAGQLDGQPVRARIEWLELAPQNLLTRGAEELAGMLA